MALEGRSALWEIFWMAAIRSCQGTSVFTCFPAMFSQHVVDLWLSLEEFGIQKSINKLHWSVMWGCHSDWWNTDSFSPVCEGKTTASKVPRQMTRDPVRIQCRMFLLVKLPQWKFLSWKAAHFAQRYVDIATFRTLLLSRFWIYQLYKYSVGLVYPTQEGNLETVW